MRVEQVPEPEIVNARDAIVRVTATAICGSDLHLYNGFVPTMRAGDIVGHEFMGEVVEVGPGVRSLAAGDRVVVPFPISWRVLLLPTRCARPSWPAATAAPSRSSAYGGFVDKLPAGSLMNRSLTIRTGQTRVQRYMRPLLARIQHGEIDPSFVITHRMRLDDARTASRSSTTKRTSASRS